MYFLIMMGRAESSLRILLLWWVVTFCELERMPYRRVDSACSLGCRVASSSDSAQQQMFWVCFDSL